MDKWLLLPWGSRSLVSMLVSGAASNCCYAGKAKYYRTAPLGSMRLPARSHRIINVYKRKVHCKMRGQMLSQCLHPVAFRGVMASGEKV